jgi:hypothetical protein
MRLISVFALALAAGALACASAQAQTQPPRRHAHPVQPSHYAAAPEIVVKKRSFLDAGNVVPVGSQSRYMDGSTIYNGTPGGTYRNEMFGDGTALPGPFDLPNFQRYAPW